MTGWTDDAACHGHDTWFWFDQYTVAYAQAICRSCPVARVCLREALDRGEQYGVWGGVDLTPRAGRRVGVKRRARLREAVS